MCNAGRRGGDAFVVIGLGPDKPEELPAARDAVQSRVLQATAGACRLDKVKLLYPGASVGVLLGTQDVDAALQAADALMHQVKQERKPG